MREQELTGESLVFEKDTFAGCKMLMICDPEAPLPSQLICKQRNQQSGSGKSPQASFILLFAGFLYTASNIPSYMLLN